MNQVSLISEFQRWVASDPDRWAVTDGRVSLTYRELDLVTTALAGELQTQVGRQGRVGVLLPRSIESVVAFLAIWKAGGSYVPLDEEMPESRLRELIAAVRPVALIGVSGAKRDDGLPWFTVDLAAGVGESEPRLIARGRSSDDEAYVLFTSGSTGQPKGVAVPDEAILRLVKEPNFVELKSSDVLLHFASISFDAATFEVWGALLNGAGLAVVLESRPSVAVMGRFIEENKCTVAWFTAGLFNVLVDSNPAVLKPLRHILAGGEALSPRHVARAYAALPDVVITNGYGPTENTTFTCCYAVPRADDIAAWKSIPIGTAITGTTVHVVADDLSPVEDGELGELLTGGGGLALGYVDDAELTAEKFVSCPGLAEGRLYRTGDIVFRRPDGLIEFVERRDDQVKINGFRIEPNEVAFQLNKHEQIDETIAVAQRLSTGGKRLVAYVVEAAGATAQESDLKAWLKETLPLQMIPARVILMDSFPLNANGKVDRKLLPNPFKTEAVIERVTAGDSGSSERDFLKLGAEVLQLPTVDPELSFTAQGGDSLTAMTLLARWEQMSGRALRVGDLLMHQPIRGCATRAVRAERVDGGTEQGEILWGDTATGPLSVSQEQIWFQAKSRPESLAYNVNCRIDFGAKLNRVALQQSMDEVFRTYAILHAVLVPDDRIGSPHWECRPELPLPWELVDLSGLTPDEGKAETARQIEAAMQVPFELLGAVFIKWYGWIQPGGELVVLQCEHHLIHDGWSLERILREWSNRYDGLVGKAGWNDLGKGEARSYFDFCRWQHQLLGSASGKKSLQFWKQKLTDMPHGSFPVENTGVRDEESGGVLREEIPSELVARIHRFSTAEGMSQFEVYLAAFVGMLSEEIGGKEIGLGIGVANRSQLEFSETAGMFVNMVAMRIAREKWKESWWSFRNRVAESLREVLPHQHIPFERVVRELNPERLAGRNPFFEILFSMHQRGSRKESFGGNLSYFEEALDNRSSKFDLTAFLIQEPGKSKADASRIWVRWEYRRSRFKARTMRRRFRRFVELLEVSLVHHEWVRWGRANPGKSSPELRVQKRRAAADAKAHDIESNLVATIIAQWNPHFPNEEILADSNFFHIGGHSLLGLELLASMEKFFDRALPINSLFEAPTPLAYARLMITGSEMPPVSLTRLNETEGNPMIFIHGWKGEIFGFMGLAQVLEGRVGAMGLHTSPGFLNQAKGMDELAALYAAYIDEKLNLPTYRLCGYSVGGIFAWATALALQKRGKSVETLMMIDSRPYHLPKLKNLWTHRNWAIDQVKKRYYELQEKGVGQLGSILGRGVRTLIYRAKRKVNLGAEMVHQPAWPKGVESDLTQALATHWLHREYAGELDILWSADTKVDLESAWSFWSKGKVRIHPIAGPHLELLESPYVQLVADSIEQALAQKMKVREAAVAEKRD